MGETPPDLRTFATSWCRRSYGPRPHFPFVLYRIPCGYDMLREGGEAPGQATVDHTKKELKMAIKKKSHPALWILLAIVGVLGCYLVITIGCGALLWTQVTRLATEFNRPVTQTEGPVPQPNLDLTSQTVDQVRELYRIPLPGFVYDLAWSPDGLKLATATVGSGGKPGSVQVWDAVSGNKLRSFDQIRIERIAFSPDGQMLAAAGFSGVIAWNVVDGDELIYNQKDYPGVSRIAFSPDSRMLAYPYQNMINLVEMPGGGGLKAFEHAGEVIEFAFLPDGKSLISAFVVEGDGYVTTFTVWDIDSGQAVRTFSRPGRIANWVVSPDGKSLAAAISSKTLSIWDMESGRELQTFSGFQFGVPRFTFSTDGSVLAAGEGVGFESAAPGGLRLFDVATGREVPLLRGHRSAIKSVAFSPNGRLLATGSDDMTIRLWGVPPNK